MAIVEQLAARDRSMLAVAGRLLRLTDVEGELGRFRAELESPTSEEFEGSAAE